MLHYHKNWCIESNIESNTCAFFFTFAVKSRTAQQAKMKWVVNIVFYILQVGGNCKPFYLINLMVFNYCILTILEIKCEGLYCLHNDKLIKYLLHILHLHIPLPGCSDDFLDMEVLF